jgi:hypothetical protein
LATTTQIRSWWAPACTGPFTKVALYGKGMVSVRPDVVDAVHALSTCLERYEYATRAADTGAYNCRKITGGTGYSLHAYGVALDVNWLTNAYGRTLVTDMPKAMVAAIKAIRTVNGKQVWRWGGDYVGNKDAMHYEVVAHPADLATGIDPESLPLAIPKPKPPAPAQSEETDMYFLSAKSDPGVWFFEQGRRTLVNNADDRTAIAKAAGIANTVAEVSDGCFKVLADGRTRHQ